MASQPARGQIYYVDWGEESEGVMEKARPSLIVQNDVGNRNSPYVIVAAIHHETDKRLPVTVPVPKGTAGLQKNSMIDCGFIYTIPQEALGNFLGALSTDYMMKVDKALKISFALR
jgi:mRNA interferase MazF